MTTRTDRYSTYPLRGEAMPTKEIDWFKVVTDITQDHYYDTLVQQRGYPEAYRLVVDEVKKLRLQLRQEVS